MEFKGTKGEWYIQGEEYPAIESRETGVVMTHPTIANVVSTFRNKEEYTANAKLIACAPEMLASLKDCLMHFESHKEIVGDQNNAPDWLIKQVGELIKKSTTI